MKSNGIICMKLNLNAVSNRNATQIEVRFPKHGHEWNAKPTQCIYAIRSRSMHLHS